MKRTSLFFLLPLIFFSCAATRSVQSAKSAPVWLTDEGRLDAFPHAEYVSALGVGGSVQNACSEAASSIAGYLRLEVERSVRSQSSFYSRADSEGKRDFAEHKALEEETFLRSQETLYLTQYTHAYFVLEENLYYCVAYINRAEAWNYVRPKLESLEKNFYFLRSAAESEPEPFKKILLFQEAKNALENFYPLYDFATVISPSEAVQFERVVEKFGAASVALKKLQSENPLRVQVNGDSDNRIKTKLCAVLEERGFLISHNVNVPYAASCDAVITPLKTGALYSVYPEMTVSIMSKTGTLHSATFRPSRVAARTEEAARNLAVNALCTSVENLLVKKIDCPHKRE